MSESVVVPMVKSESDTPKLIIEARVREMLPSSLKVSSEFLDELNQEAVRLVSDAVVACKNEGRNTLKGRDALAAARTQLDRLKSIVSQALQSV